MDGLSADFLKVSYVSSSYRGRVDGWQGGVEWMGGGLQHLVESLGKAISQRSRHGVLCMPQCKKGSGRLKLFVSEKE